MDNLKKEDITNIIENKTFLLPRIAGKKLTAQILNEMIAYKSIEETLGIDLVTLFIALKDGVYWRNVLSNFHVSIDYCENIRISDHGHCIYVFDRNLEHWIDLYIKDYGKTWSLTKKELL